jgi:hypothetical protein
MSKKKSARTQHPTNGQRAKKTVPREPREQIAVALKINRTFPAGQLGVSSNHFVVQNDGPEFHLLFFQAHLPIFLEGSEEEKAREIARYQRDGVLGVCIARIIVAAERMPEFIQAMQANFVSYQTRKGTQSGAEK